MTRLAALPSRAVLAIEGQDRITFLQGLVSNDVTEAAPGRAVWACHWAQVREVKFVRAESTIRRPAGSACRGR